MRSSTYSAGRGGNDKTHTLITLYHLVNDPKKLPDLPAVREFKEAFGGEPPRTRVAALCFDKIDPNKGTEAISPSGEKRWLKHPWNILAYQLAGEDGLEAIGAEEGAERFGGERNLPVRIAPPAVAVRRLNRSTAADATRLFSVE